VSCAEGETMGFDPRDPSGSRKVGPAEAVEQATGWKPPVCYDLSRDEWRLVTQDDITRWQRLEMLYREIGEHVREIQHARRQFHLDLNMPVPEHLK
jgi:hypothetical protein